MALSGRIVNGGGSGSTITVVNVTGKGILKLLAFEELSNDGTSISITIDGVNTAIAEDEFGVMANALSYNRNTTYGDTYAGSGYGLYNFDGDSNIGTIMLNLPFSSSLTITATDVAECLVTYMLEV